MHLQSADQVGVLFAPFHCITMRKVYRLAPGYPVYAAKEPDMWFMVEVRKGNDIVSIELIFRGAPPVPIVPLGFVPDEHIQGLNVAIPASKMQLVAIQVL